MGLPIPEDEQLARERKIKLMIGFGVPALIAGGISIALGIPWWIILVVLAVLGAGMMFNT